MALNFPSNPTTNQTYQSGSSATYRYNGELWTVVEPSPLEIVFASSASFATTASFTLSSSFATSASLTATASLASTASFVNSLSQSVLISGSLNVLNNELSVTSTGVNIGTIITDRHTVTGSLSITGSAAITGSLNVGGDITTADNLVSSRSTGNLGGGILLVKPQTNTTIAGTGITIDSFRDTIRIFEQGGALRGGFYDITQLSGSALTNLYGEQATYLHAKKTGTQTIASNGAPIVSGYATPTVSINAGEWNGTTGIFTATKAGTYMVTIQVQYTTATYTGGTALSAAIGKNGVEQNSINWFSFDAGYVGIPPTIQCRAIVTLVPSNEVYAVTFNGTTSSKTVAASGTSITIQELPTRVFR